LPSSTLQASGARHGFSLYQKAALFCGQVVSNLAQVLGLVPELECGKVLDACVHETSGQSQATEQKRSETQKGSAI
jgi:hypothetical protein